MLSDILLNKQVYRIETFGYLLFYERERERENSAYNAKDFMP